jgi:hypothetical protein
MGDRQRLLSNCWKCNIFVIAFLATGHLGPRISRVYGMLQDDLMLADTMWVTCVIVYEQY